jgi:hypothetical protein
MASHRVAELVKSRIGLSDEEIQSMSEQDAWQCICANASLSAPTEDENCENAPDTGSH